MKTLHSFTRILFILHLFEISLYYLLAFLYFFAGITQLYRTCGKIATYQYAPQEISQFWRFSPPSHSIVPLLPAFGRFRERHGQLPGGAGPYPQPMRRPDRRHSFPFLHAVFVICVSRSPTYEVLISFAAKYRQPQPCLPAFMRAVYASREF